MLYAQKERDPFYEVVTEINDRYHADHIGWTDLETAIKQALEHTPGAIAAAERVAKQLHLKAK